MYSQPWLSYLLRLKVKNQNDSASATIITLTIRSHSLIFLYCLWSWGSLVSTLSDYRLHDRDRSPAETKDSSSSPCLQTSSEAHPTSYPMGTSSSFLGVTRVRSVTLTSHPHLVPWSRMSRSYISSPP
jgi:hypothetical protein